MPRLTKIFILLLILIITGCSGTKKEAKQEELPEAIVERIALTDLAGKPVDLDDFKGKVVFLNYWATWCRPCIAEMPDIDAAAKILGDEDFVFLAASDESLEKIKNYVDEVDFSFQFVKSTTSVFDMDIMALPTTMILNKQGEIIYNEVGARQWDSDSELNRLRDIASK